MLRRTATVAKWALAAVAVLLLAWWPVSYTRGLTAHIPLTGGWVRLWAANGVFATTWFDHDPPDDTVTVEVYDSSFGLFAHSQLVPVRKELRLGRLTHRWVTVPLWQLGVAAAAWPGASVIARARRRRRGGRGFAVVPPPAGQAAPGRP